MNTDCILEKHTHTHTHANINALIFVSACADIVITAVYNSQTAVYDSQAAVYNNETAVYKVLFMRLTHRTRRTATVETIAWH